MSYFYAGHFIMQLYKTPVISMERCYYCRSNSVSVNLMLRRSVQVPLFFFEWYLVSSDLLQLPWFPLSFHTCTTQKMKNTAVSPLVKQHILTKIQLKFTYKTIKLEMGPVQVDDGPRGARGPRVWHPCTKVSLRTIHGNTLAAVYFLT